jgi:hypothetical protein
MRRQVDTDRVTVDFEGKIDGEPFAGGKAEDYQFIVGDGQMLKEFEEAVRGMKLGESKTFQLAFPADYHGKDVAGKTADFMVTVKKIERPICQKWTALWPNRWVLLTHRRRPACRHSQESGARSEAPSAGTQQAGGHGCIVVQGELDLPKSACRPNWSA